MLLDARPDIDINLADRNGQTVIHIAFTEKDERTLQVLLDERKDIDIDHDDNKGETALSLSASSYQSSLVLMLPENSTGLALNANLEDERTALHIMLENGLFREPNNKQFDETDR